MGDPVPGAPADAFSEIPMVRGSTSPLQELGIKSKPFHTPHPGLSSPFPLEFTSKPRARGAAAQGTASCR